MKIPFNDLKRQHERHRKTFHKALDVIINDSAFILGKHVETFEDRLSKYCNTNYSIGVSSGISALYIALKSLGLKENSEVIVPVNSFIATANAVKFANLIPRFVDVNEKDYLIDVSHIKNVISKTTTAIIPVHLHGRVCNMPEIMDVARHHGLRVIEDAAQSLGAKYMNQQSGSFGDAGCFSFYPGKNLGALGDGGAIVTDCQHIFASAKLYRNYGSNVKYEHLVLAGNDRLDGIQSLFLTEKLNTLERSNSRRRAIAARYQDQIVNKRISLPPQDDPNRCSVWHNFVIRTDSRDRLRKYLADNGIETNIHYPNIITSSPVYKSIAQDNYPNAVRQSNEILSIPIFPELTEAEIEFIIHALNQYE